MAISDQISDMINDAFIPFYRAIESHGSPKEIMEETGLGKDENKKGKKVLVAYYTKHGSTSSIAREIALELVDLGFQVDLRSITNLMHENISGYDAYVFGSAIYWAALKAIFVQFLDNQRDAFAGKPAALFAVCGTIQRDNEINRERVNSYIDASISKVPEFKPFNTELFPGKIEYEKMSKPEAFIMKTLIKVTPLEAGDKRDWNKVRNWVHEIGDGLK